MTSAVVTSPVGTGTVATSTEDLALRYGTPAYVYDLDRVRAARADLFAALPDGFDVFYAAKANPHPDLLRALREPGAGGRRGCRVEISSEGELRAALTAGFDGSEVLYTGPGKTAAELAVAIAAGVRLFSTDSVTDVARVGRVAVAAGTEVDCLLRVNSASASARTSIRMTGTPSQFGFDSEVLPDVCDDLLRVDGVRIAGLHLFPLSNAVDEDSLVAEFLHTIELAGGLQERLGIRFRLVDIGGGFAAPYAVPGDRPTYRRLAAELTAAIDRHFPGWRDGEVRFACESGRYLVADCGELICGVVNLKESRGRRFVVLDAGINTFGGMAGLGRLLPLAVRPAPDAGEPVQRASLVGPLCTPGDVLGRELSLPDLAPGDTVAIPNAGAYGPTASLLMFLGRPAPTEIVVSGGEVVSATRIEHTRTGVPPVGGPAVATTHEGVPR